MTKSKEPAHIQEEEEFEHGSNTFGFFHRHQKIIIYTAGIFTLVTFSITAAITDFFDQFGRENSFAEMQVPGVGRVVVTEEDQAIAQGIRRVRGSIFTLGYFSPLGVGESDSQYTDQLAALRAIAVKVGINASDDDVNKINNSAISSFPNLSSVEQLAARAGTNDLRLYNTWMREAVRVSTFLRLAVLGLDQTATAALDAVLEKNEVVSFKVAYVDNKAFKEGLEKSLTDETLKTFLADMDTAKSDRYRKLANRVAIKIAMLDQGAFKHEPYLGVEIDKQAQIGDAQVQERYQLHREERYKKPAPPAPKPQDGGGKGTPDASKKPEEGKKAPGENKDNGSVDPLAQAPETKQGEGKPGEAKPAEAKPAEAKPAEAKQDTPKQDDGYEPLDDALRQKIKEQLFAEMVLSKWQASLDRAMASHMVDAINTATAADIAESKAREAKIKADADLEAKSEDAELKKLAETAKAELEVAEKASKLAKDAVDTRRATFDFKAEVEKLAKGRPGLTFIAMDEMKSVDELAELVELGAWKDSHLPGQMTLAGEIYNGRVQNTEKGSFIFQVSKIEDRPFKDFKDIKDDLQEEYLTEQAEKNAKDKKELFEKTLETLSRAQLKDEIAKLQKAGAEQIDADFNTWITGLEARVKKIEAVLDSLGDERLVGYKKKKGQLDKIREELVGADDKKKALTETIDKETEDKVVEKLKEAHKDVLDQAGKAAGFKVEVLGPLSREVQSLPRFKYRFSNVIQAVFGANASDAEADEVTELAEDVINGVTYMAVCTKVEKATASQLTRRQWLAKVRGSGYAAKSFAGSQMLKAVDHSFTIAALEKGYGWLPPSGLPADKGLAPKKGDGKGKDGAKAPKKPDDK